MCTHMRTLWRDIFPCMGPYVTAVAELLQSGPRTVRSAGLTVWASVKMVFSRRKSTRAR